LPSAEGAHASEVSWAGAFPVNVNDWETLFKVAVSKAVWFVVIEATVAVKVPVLDPAPTLTLAGTVMLALLLDSPTLTALEEAAVKVTVQLDVPGAFTVPGEQLKLLSWAAAVRLIVAGWLTPLRVAVTVALWLVAIVPDVAAKVAVLCPTETVTFA